MYFQLVDNQVLSTQGQPDVNLHRLTGSVFGASGAEFDNVDLSDELTVLAETVREVRRCRLTSG